MLEIWRRYRKRPQEDRNVILRAALLLPLTQLGLRIFGFQQWKNLIENVFLPSRHSEFLPMNVQREWANRAARALRSAELHGPTDPNCLERSMAMWWILRRAGVDAELHIGARKESGKLEAHAWIELDDQVLNDSAEVHGHYARFDAPIAAAESRMSGQSDPDGGGKAA